MFEKKEIRLVIYYAALILLYMLASFRGIDIGSFARLVVLGLIVGPLFVSHSEWLPAITTLFYTIGTSNYNSTLLPVDPKTYLIVLLIGIFILKQKAKYPVLKPLFALIFLTGFVNLISFGSWESITSTLIWTATFFFYTPFFEEKHVVAFSYVFVIISLVISVSRIVLGSGFTDSYMNGTELERTALIDINYAACVVGMGIISGAIILFKGYAHNIVIKSTVAVTLVISLVTLALNASRTSFLAVAAAILVLLLFSNVKSGYKLLSALLILALIIVLYNNSYFELLEYRVENDVGGGSYRTEIWQKKIDAFFSEGTVINWLFGFGLEPASSLGIRYAFHNDYLAFCCEYGFIGLALFLSLFFIPFKHCGFRNAPALAVIVYLMVVSLTLEPFAAGRLPYYGFWFYALLTTSLTGDKSKLS